MLASILNVGPRVYQVSTRADKRDKDPKLSHNLWQDPFQVKVFGSATNCTNSCRFFIKLSFETVFLITVEFI